MTVDFFKKQIIREVFNEIGKEIEHLIEIPPDSKLGDYSLPCFELSKELKKSPVKISEEISKNIKIKDIVVKSIGPYVNFYIDNKKIAEVVIEDIINNEDNYGQEEQKKETIVIDYSAPNVAKNMGIHNLRSTIIGQALVNIYRKLGFNVIGVNHLGDWGTQFGKLIWALEKWSNPEELKEKGIMFLNEMYVKYHTHSENNPEIDDEARAWFKKIEDNDKRAKMWWDVFVEISIKDYNDIYERLNISFTETKGESFYIKYLDETIKTLDEKKLTKISQDALVVDLEEYGLPPCLLKKKDGATLYGTRDIATALYRLKKYNPKKVLYVVDIAQELHFKQVFKVLELLDDNNKDIFEHVSFGRLSFPDKAMSTRKGNIIPLKEVLDKAKEKVLEIIKEKNPDLAEKEKVSEIVGVGSIIFGDLSHDRIHNIIFEWDRVLDFQGETASYIQYTIVRINSILKKEKINKKINYNNISSDKEKEIIKLLGNFNFVINESAKQNKPHHIAKYSLLISQYFNNYYVNNKIIQEDIELMESRLLLIYCIKIVLENSLKLLNIKVPKEM